MQSMQCVALAGKFRISSESRRKISLFWCSNSELCEGHILNSLVFYPEGNTTVAEIKRLTYACDRKVGIFVKDSAMLTAVSAGIAGLPQPWKCPGINQGCLSLGQCIAAPVRISVSPQRDEFYHVATACRRRQFFRVSSPSIQASSELRESEEPVDPKVMKPTIYDTLQIDNVTLELFPELDFVPEGNFYPKLLRLVVRKIDGFLEEEGGEEKVPELLNHLGMKLTPHLVAEVMKLQKNANQAKQFFDWAGNQPGFQHNSHTYNLTFWNLLNRRHGDPRHLVRALVLLEEMIAVNLNPGNMVCNVLIDRLCKDGKVGAALNLAKVLEGNTFPDIYTYNSLMNGLSKSGQFKEMFELLNEMKQKRCNPDVITYNSIINGLCKAGQLHEVFQLVDEMTQKGRIPDRFTYNSIINGFCTMGRWQEALKVVDEFPKKNIAPDVITYNSLIVGLLKCGQLGEARKVHDGMVTRGCRPDLVTYNILIDGFMHFSEVDEAWKLFHYMEEDGFSPDHVTYNTLIVGLVENFRMEEAHRAFELMQEKGCKANSATYTLLGLSEREHNFREDWSHEKVTDSGNSSFSDPYQQATEDELQLSHN